MTFDTVPYLGREHEVLRAVSGARRLTDEFKDLPLVTWIHSLHEHKVIIFINNNSSNVDEC